MKVVIRDLGLQDYQTCWQSMQLFTMERDEKTLDEIWFLQHEPVFTQGQNGKAEHILQPGDIPIVPVDRGGQVTYHGPGQLVVYFLIDIKRKNMHVRGLVSALEKSIIELLAEYQVTANAKREAPGIYVNEKKICSIGLRIKRGCSYHGLAFNVDMDLSPFLRINPCGFAKLQMTQVIDCTTLPTDDAVNWLKLPLQHYLMSNLGYTSHLVETGIPYGTREQTTR